MPAPVSRNPLANGLLSIFNCVICSKPKKKKKKKKISIFILLISSSAGELEGEEERIGIRCRVRRKNEERKKKKKSSVCDTNLFILISRDGDEFRLLEDISAKRAVG